MVVNSVSSFSFRGNEAALSRPGAYARPNEQLAPQIQEAPVKQKKSKTGKILLSLALATAAVLGGAAALKHYVPNTFKILGADALTNAPITQKITHYVATLGNGVIEKSTAAIEGVKNLLPKRA